MALTALMFAAFLFQAPAEPAADARMLELAYILEDIAVAHRTQGRAEQALDFFEMAVEIRRSLAESPRVEFARGLTAVAILRLKIYGPESAVEGLQRAIEEWDAAAPGDPLALRPLEALAAIYRDQARYLEAQPLLLRLLRTREASSGPDDAELISSVDSLAYVEFGLRDFAAAEPLYQRLLDLWDKNAGPDHPMLALTLDKMAEFYAFQQRYAEAEDCATRALAIRTRLHVASLNQTGRILLMEAKLPEAEDLYRRAVEIGDLARTPDEVMDPVLRIHAKILRVLERPAEADALETRVKDALFRKADREGRRPSPVKFPSQ